jgi:hypothetical protein
MRPADCPRSSELVDALQAASRLEACDARLRAHVAACPSCADLAAIVEPLVDDHRRVTGEGRVASAETMWWRMRLRARREATAAAVRPIGVLQGVSVAAGVGLLLAAVSFVFPTVRAFARWAIRPDGPAAGSPAASAMAYLASPLGIAVMLAAALVLVITPVAIYLTVRDE